MPNRLAKIIETAAQIGYRISTARLSHGRKIFTRSEFNSHPTYVRMRQQNRQGISLPSGLNLERLCRGTSLVQNQEPLNFYRVKLDLEKQHQTTIVDGEYICPKMLANTAIMAPFMTHRCREVSHVQQIIHQGQFRDVGLSSGTASQPGICLSSGIWGNELIDHLLAIDSQPRIWGTVPHEQIRIGQSTCMMADGTTYKGEHPELAIEPHAYFTVQEGLTILNAQRFVTCNLAALSFRMLSNLRDWDNLAGYLLTVNATLDMGIAKLADKHGNLYDVEALIKLSPRQLIDAVGDNLLDFAVKCDTITNTGFAQRVSRLLDNSTKIFESAQKVTADLYARPELGSNIVETGLDQLASPLGVDQLVAPTPRPHS